LQCPTSRHYSLVPHNRNRLSSQLSEMARQMDSGMRVLNTANKFAIQMDVAQYKPDEIDVKVQNNQLLVSGKHEEMQDGEHGFISRSFTRRYALPQDVDEQQLKCNLNERGVLTFEAPRLQAAENLNSRAIPITHIGPDGA